MHTIIVWRRQHLNLYVNHAVYGTWYRGSYDCDNGTAPDKPFAQPMATRLSYSCYKYCLAMSITNMNKDWVFLNEGHPWLHSETHTNHLIHQCHLTLSNRFSWRFGRFCGQPISRMPSFCHESRKWNIYIFFAVRGLNCCSTAYLWNK